MGLFKHRDKSQTRPELLPPPNKQNQTEQHSDSYHDSTYYSNSNASTENGQTRPSQAAQQQQHQGPLPGTTVITTTTTTTTTTTVSADGTTHTYSQPYNPSTDPPPQASETIVDQKLPANTAVTDNVQSSPQTQASNRTNTEPPQNAPPIIKQQAPTPTQNSSMYTAPPPRKPTPQQTTLYVPPPTHTSELETTPPRSSSTTGGRVIPPRSELRTSPSFQSDISPTTQPAMPIRSEKRNSRGSIIAPLNTGTRTHENEPYTPISPTSPQNLSRPNYAPPPPPKEQTSSMTGPTAVQTERLSKREGLGAMFKGVHGAGEAIRGSVNQKIAHSMHDTAEEERMRSVREKGMGEFRGSGLSERVPAGLREGFREKAEGRARVRRTSQDRNGVHGSEGPGGLGVVEETRNG